MTSTCPLLHLVTVGFHHRRGAIVELAYPDFGCNGCTSFNDGSINVPSQWKHLPSLALPDGAHNYLRDVVYFTLPDLDGKSAVFGVAVYRQIESTFISCPSPEVTRNTVQKSLVVLSRVPLFSFIAHHLSRIADSLFQDGGFNQECLRKSFTLLEEQVTTMVNDPTLYKDALLFKLSASNFVRVYARNALVLFKLLLLERRVLFTGDSAGWISNWILTLLSLVPDLLNNGLSQCATVNRSWLSDPDCYPHIADLRLNGTNRDVRSNSLFFPGDAKSRRHGKAGQPRLDNHVTYRRMNKMNMMKRSSSDTNIFQSKHESNYSHAFVSSVPYDSVLSELTARLTLLRNSSVSPTDPSPEPAVQLPSSLPFATDYWGFPLALFTQSNILPIYASLGNLDVLLEPLSGWSHCEASLEIHDRCVRGFLAGSTNPLLQTHRKLAEVIVPTASPTAALNPTEDTGHASLTSPFESTNRLMASRVSTAVPASDSGNSAQPAGNKLQASGPKALSAKRPTLAVQFCASADGTSEGNPRATPCALSQALQLSRLDRTFIDSLYRLVTSWYQARSVLSGISRLSSSDELDEWFCHQGSVDEYLDKLPPAQRTALLRFPSTTIFDSFVRRQFSTYLRSLLLTSRGYGDGPNDFNGSYIECFRSTRTFRVWTCNFVMEKALLVPNSHLTASASSVEISDSSCQDNSGMSLLYHAGDDPSIPTSTDSAVFLFAQHPGKRSVESDDWEQFVDGVKRFRELATDRGRRLFSQGAQSLTKLTIDLNSSLRSGVPSTVISKFSSAFKSLLTSTSSVTNP